MLGWSAGTAAGLAGALSVAYLAGGSEPPAESGAVTDAVFRTLSRPVPAVTMALIALAVAASCFRQLRLQWLAWRPGGIRVDTFGVGPGAVSADAAHLTMAFRQRLAEMRLSAPTPVPGAPPGGDFLDVLDRDRLDARNVLGSLLTVLRAATPRVAWEVRGVLVSRSDGALDRGVTVQVVNLPDRADPPRTVWAATWEEAVRHAADHATAAILPRTRLCRAPWAAWKRRDMPGELLGSFEDAARLEADRRYEEALDAYYRASERDPMNLALRLCIGKLQEKLALPLDALITYVGMTAVSASLQPGGDRASRLQRERALQAARYRAVVLFGGSELAEQWRTTGPMSPAAWTARDVRRRELRDRVRRPLQERLELIAERHRDGTDGADPAREIPLEDLRRYGRTPPAVLLAEAAGRAEPDGTPAHEDPACLELRELFALAALAELRSLEGDGRGALRERPRVLTPTVIRLTRLCIEVRLAWVQHRLRPAGAAAAWPPTAEGLDARIGALEGPRGFGRWQEHYNAACAYGLPLMAALDGAGDPEALAGTLACRAVERLARAASCADSAYVAGRREWLLCEDPDLDGLRAHPRFKEFEAMYFPSARPTPQRPRHAQRLQAARHARDLVVTTAERWERTWRARGRTPERVPDVSEVLEWWTTEQEALRLVRRVAVDHRHWPVRLELISRLREWGRDHDFEPPVLRFQPYETEPLEQVPGRAPAEDAARTAAARIDARLAAVGRVLADGPRERQAVALMRTLERWQATLRRPDGRHQSPAPDVVAAVCDHQAAFWRLLAEWLADEPGARPVLIGPVVRAAPLSPRRRGSSRARARPGSGSHAGASRRS